MLHPLTPGIALGKAGETPDSATAREERLVVSWEEEVRRGREGGRTERVRRRGRSRSKCVTVTCTMIVRASMRLLFF